MPISDEEIGVSKRMMYVNENEFDTYYNSLSFSLINLLWLFS